MARKAGFLALLVGVLLMAMWPAGSSRAAININVEIGVPPPVAFSSPPEVVIIPGTYVYYAPAVDFDLFFYQGYWWRPWHGHWYRSNYYRGPWVFIAPRRMPRPIMALPPGWHGRRSRFEPIPYGQLRRNWRRWERERYWERDERWHEGGWHHGGDHGEHEDHGMGRGMGRGRD